MKNKRSDLRYPLIYQQRYIRTFSKIGSDVLLQNKELKQKFYSTFSPDPGKEFADFYDPEKMKNYFLPDSGTEDSDDDEEDVIDIDNLSDPLRIHLLMPPILELYYKERIEFRDAELGSDSIVTSGYEYILHFVIPKIMDDFIVHYRDSQSSDSMNSINEGLNRFIQLFPALHANIMASTSFFQTEEPVKTLDLTPENCTKKIIHYLLIQLNAKNHLAKISHCDPVYQYLLSAAESNDEELKAIIQKLSIIAATSAEKTAAMNAFLTRYPVVSLFHDQSHSFYYWLKTIMDPELLKKILEGYENAFVKSKKITVKPLLELILQQSPEFIYLFMRVTVNYLKGKLLDILVEQKINLLVGLVKEWYFVSEMRGMTSL
ncbi:MAG: hypothetical protein ACRCXC_08905 [Legionella sp.]